MKRLFIFVITCLMLASCDTQLNKVKEDIIVYETTKKDGEPKNLVVKRSMGTSENIFVTKMNWQFPKDPRVTNPIYNVYSYDSSGKIYEWHSTLKYHLIEQEFPEALAVDDYRIVKNYDIYKVTKDYERDYDGKMNHASAKEHEIYWHDQIEPNLDSLNDIEKHIEMISYIVERRKIEQDSLNTPVTDSIRKAQITQEILSIEAERQDIINRIHINDSLRRVDMLMKVMYIEVESQNRINRINKEADSLINVRYKMLENYN